MAPTDSFRNSRAISTRRRDPRRRGPYRRLARVSAFLLFLIGSARADQPASAFLPDAEAAWGAYTAYSKKLQGSLKSTAYSFAEGKRSVRRVVTGEYKQSDPRWLAVALTTEDATNDTNNRGTASVLTGAGAFRLTRRDVKSPWILTHFSPDEPTPDWIKTSDPRVAVARHTQASLSLYGVKLADLRTRPGFTFTTAASEQRNGEDLVRLDFAYRPVDTKTQVPFRDGWVRVEPSRSWLMREFRFDGEWADGKAVCRGEFDYAKGPTGQPIVKHSHEITERIEAGKVVPLVEYELDYDFHEQEAVPPEEFTLAAFGLPEPTARRREVPTYWYLTGAGIACLVLAGAFRWRSRRAAAPATSASP